MLQDKLCVMIPTRFWIVIQGVPMNSLRFLFEGQRIADNQTPKEVCFPLLFFFPFLFPIFIYIPSVASHFYPIKIGDVRAVLS